MSVPTMAWIMLVGGAGFLLGVLACLGIQALLEARREWREHDEEWGGGLDDDTDVTRIIEGLADVIPARAERPVRIDGGAPPTARLGGYTPRHSAIHQAAARRLVHYDDGTREMPLVHPKGVDHGIEAREAGRLRPGPSPTGTDQGGTGADGPEGAAGAGGHRSRRRARELAGG